MNVEVSKRITVLCISMSEKDLGFTGDISINTDGEISIKGKITCLVGESIGTIDRVVKDGKIYDNSTLSGAPVTVLPFSQEVFRVSDGLLSMFADSRPLPGMTPAAAPAEETPTPQDTTPDVGDQEWGGEGENEHPSVPPKNPGKPTKPNKK